MILWGNPTTIEVVSKPSNFFAVQTWQYAVDPKWEGIFC